MPTEYSVIILDMRQASIEKNKILEAASLLIADGGMEGLIKGGAPIVILSYFSMPINGILFGDMIWQNTPEQIWYDWLFSMSWDAIRVHED